MKERHRNTSSGERIKSAETTCYNAKSVRFNTEGCALRESTFRWG